MKPHSWILCFLALLAPGTVCAAQPDRADQKPEKPPWEWTLEERIAARYDMKQVEERKRVRLQTLRDRGWHDQADLEAQNSANYQNISGRDNPELFLPMELFDSFLSATFHHDREWRLDSRKLYAARSSMELDEDFWRDISVIASNLLAKRHRYYILEAEVEAAPSEDKERLEELARVERKQLFKGFCGELKQALDEARALYGAATFDRFLYETVQPGRIIGEYVEPEAASSVRRRERGCKDAP